MEIFNLIFSRIHIYKIRKVNKIIHQFILVHHLIHLKLKNQTQIISKIIMSSKDKEKLLNMIILMKIN